MSDEQKSYRGTKVRLVQPLYVSETMRHYARFEELEWPFESRWSDEVAVAATDTNPNTMK